MALPTFSFSTPRLTWKARFKKIGVQVDCITDDKLNFFSSKHAGRTLSSFMDNRHVKRGERKLVYEDNTNLDGWSM